MKNTLGEKRGLIIALAVAAIVAMTAIGSASIFKSKKASFASTQKMSPEAAAEAETEALSSHFILPTDPESRVRMPLHTKVITDWAPPHRRHHYSLRVHQ